MNRMGLVFKKKRRARIWGGKALRRELEGYVEKLAGSKEPIGAEEIARAQSVKLMIEDRQEWRLRSLQSLIDTGHGGGIVPALNELMMVCTEWPDEDAVQSSLFLLEMIRQYWSGSPAHGEVGAAGTNLN